MVEPTTLVTERLVLRPYVFADVEPTLRRALTPGFARFLPLPDPYMRRDAEEFIARMMLRSWDTNPSFSVTFQAEQIGDVNARIDAQSATAEIGYGLDPKQWGKGYTTEAASAVVSWVFETFAVAKVCARADAENIGSWRVMEKLGMTREGYFRSQRLLRGQRRDEVYYGVLREERGAGAGD